LLPITDGGDGFGQAMGALLRAKTMIARTVDAAHRLCLTKWWWEPKTKTAIIESAAAVGLAILPTKRFHPFDLDTFGLGRLIEAAVRKGATRCLIGIGGSATNDAGFGLARALGWEFFDRDGAAIKKWTDLARLEQIRAPQRRRWFKELLVAVDVQNPLLGKRGATRIYGPQKGMRPEDFETAERCLRRLAVVAKTELGLDFAKTPGAGAAGGLGFGLATFAGGKLKPGFDLFAEQSHLDRHLRQAELVITGEGCIDHSTLMGKGVGEIARKCNELGIPCIAVAGVAHHDRRLDRMFDRISALLDITTEKQAKSKPEYWLEHAANRVATNLAHSDIHATD
jgi:glycerate kinase